MKNYKFITAVFLLIIIAGGGLFSQSDEAADADGAGDLFDLSVPLDAALLAAGTALVAADFFIEPAEGEQQPLDEILFPDRYAVFEYNEAADTASDVLFAGSLIFPAMLAIGQVQAGQGWDSVFTTGLMFAETMLLTMGTKDLIKNFVPRYRPYTYLSDPVDDEYADSFPSGHTAMTFAVCSFSAYTFSQLFPDSKWTFPFSIGAYSAAAAVGVLRVVSGSHFITDVVIGALIGTAYGIGVPLLHKASDEEAFDMSARVSCCDEPALTIAVRL